jgi:S1 RNA binding domain protein
MQLEVGSIVEGKVTGITNFGAFVELPGGKTGMVHISEVAPTFVKEIRDYVKEGQTVKVKVLNITQEGRVSLSMKRVEAPHPVRPLRSAHPVPYHSAGRPGNFEWQPGKRNEPASFEDMMTRFKQTSDEKMSDLKRCMEAKRGGFSKRGSGSNQPK